VVPRPPGELIGILFPEKISVYIFSEPDSPQFSLRSPYPILIVEFNREKLAVPWKTTSVEGRLPG